MYYFQIATLVAVNCLLALGAYVPLSAGLMVLCLGALMSIGAIVAAAIHSNAAIPLPLAILLGGAAAAACGCAAAYMCKRLTGFLFAVATLGLGELTRVVAINLESMGGPLGFKNVELVPISSNLLWLSLTLVLCLLLLCLFEKSYVRKALTLIRDGDTLPASLGIDPSRHRVGAVAAGGFLVGIGGGFYIHSIGILDPRMFGFEQSLLILMYPILGGTKSFFGPLVGASLLTILPEAFRFSPSHRMILYGIVLVLVIVFRPEGLLRSRLFAAQHTRSIS